MIGVGCADIGKREKELIGQVLESGLITSGPLLEKFEADFAARHGCKHGLMVNSGTDALRIALAALKEANGWNAGDEVVVPALTFIATANVVIQNGLVPVFCDVDPRNFNMDPKKLVEAIGKRTRAIIPVHLFGLPCDMGPIMSIAKGCGLKVIEDSCEAMGVTYKGKSVGSFGDVACFSTYAAHLISTGVGGLAITNDEELAALMKSYANHGRNPDFLGFRSSQQLAPEAYQSTANHSDVIRKRFEFQRVGFSSRATQMEAALGLGQLARLDKIVLQRRSNSDYLRWQLRDVDEIAFQEIPGDRESASMMFPLVVDEGIERHDIMLSIEQRFVETRPFFNILGQRAYADFAAQETLNPTARMLSNQGFYVGCHQMLSPDDLDAVADAIKAAMKNTTKVAA